MSDGIRYRCDVRIVEEGGSGEAALIPNAVFINGQEVAIPRGTTIEVRTGDQEPTVVTLKLMVSSLTIEASRGTVDSVPTSAYTHRELPWCSFPS